LKFDEVKGLERMARRSAENLMAAIEASKSRGLHRLIYGLGIRHVGEHTAWVLANRYGSIKKVGHLSLEELADVPEMGPVMAESVYNFFRSKENLEILQKLKDSGLKMSDDSKKTGAVPLAGKTVVITGALKSFSRSEAGEAVRKAGGNPSSMVSKNTDFLVEGEDAGSKLDKARTLGVKIVSEEEFKKLLK
jgi:DNA ligase (NAD+)